MTAPARDEQPIAFALGLCSYFLGLTLFQPLAFMLAPIPVAANTVSQQPNRAKVYMLVAGLAGIMGIVLGNGLAIVPCVLYALMGYPVAWAILRGVAYRTLVMRATGFVFFTQILLVNFQRERIAADLQNLVEFYQNQLNDLGTGTLSDQQERNLNTFIWLFENWRDVYIGFSFAGAVIGVCVMVAWTYRMVRSKTDVEPQGSFADFRPHDATVWIAIAAALLGFVHYYAPMPILQTLCLNTAAGLLALNTLNGLSILLYGLNALKPNPFLALLVVMALFVFGGVVMLSMVGLFDTWGEFKKRIDARVQSADDAEHDTD